MNPTRNRRRATEQLKICRNKKTLDRRKYKLTFSQLYKHNLCIRNQYYQKYNHWQQLPLDIYSRTNKENNKSYMNMYRYRYSDIPMYTRLHRHSQPRYLLYPLTSPHLLPLPLRHHVTKFSTLSFPCHALRLFHVTKFSTFKFSVSWVKTTSCIHL